MAILNISYSDLTMASRNAKNVSAELGSYATKLERGVARKISSISGGQSNATSIALSETNDKLRALREKSDALNSYSTKIDKFKSNIETTDKTVAKRIKSLTGTFAKDNGFKINKVAGFFQFLAVNYVNSSSLATWVKSEFNKGKDKFNEWRADFKHWMKTGGGKYIKDIVYSAVAIVAAIGIIVFTILGGGALIFIVAGVLAAVFTILNGITNIYQSQKAYKSNKNGDPAWASRYGKTDKLSQAIKTKYDNPVGNLVANILDTTECFSNIIAGVGSIASLGKLLTTPGKTKGFVSIKQLFGSQNNPRSVGILGSEFKEIVKGRKRFTVKSVFNGTVSLIYDNEFKVKIGKSCSLFKDELGDILKYKKSTLLQGKSLLNDVFNGSNLVSQRASNILKSTFKSESLSFIKSINSQIKEAFYTGKGISEIGKKISENKYPINLTQLITPNFDKVKSGVNDIKDAIVNYKNSTNNNEAIRIN